MLAIEFKTTVKGGMIEVPSEYLDKLTNPVRVILLVDEGTKNTETLIDRMLAHPMRLKGFRPLRREDIYGR